MQGLVRKDGGFRAAREYTGDMPGRKWEFWITGRLTNRFMAAYCFVVTCSLWPADILAQCSVQTNLEPNALLSDGRRCCTESPLVDPRAVTADAAGSVYILERRGNALRVVGRDGRIRTLIKPGDVTPDLNGPKHLCMDRDGNVIIADAENHLVRRYNVKTGKTTTIVGTGEAGLATDASNPLATQINRPCGVYVHTDGVLYVTDSYNHRVLRVTGCKPFAIQ